jgi:putative oxidoreductase
MKTNIYLVAGGILSMIASLLHIAIIIGGPDWYRFFGAGEGMAQLAEGGSSYPAIITTIIAIILAIWGLYAFSGARLIGRLPLLKVVLGLISAIYVVRGVLGIPMVIYLDSSYLKELESEMTFMIVSSIISLIIGLFYSMGLIQLLQSKK